MGQRLMTPFAHFATEQFTILCIEIINIGSLSGIQGADYLNTVYQPNLSIDATDIFPWYLYRDVLDSPVIYFNGISE